MKVTTRARVFGEATAATQFVFQSADGVRRRVTLRVGKPYKRSSREWACPAEIRGFERRYPDMSGANSIQALCLAIAVVRSRVEDFINKGGRLFDVSGREEWDPMGVSAMFGLGQSMITAPRRSRKRR